MSDGFLFIVVEDSQRSDFRVLIGGPMLIWYLFFNGSICVVFTEFELLICIFHEFFLKNSHNFIYIYIIFLVCVEVVMILVCVMF